MTSKRCKENDFKYLVSHLNELDQFIICLINEKYDSIRRMYPLGVTEYVATTYYGESEIDKKERVINHQEEIKNCKKQRKYIISLKQNILKGFLPLKNIILTMTEKIQRNYLCRK